MLSLTERFDAFWDETQEHRVLVTQDMEALRFDSSGQSGHHSTAAAGYAGPARPAPGFPPASTTSTAVTFRGVPLPSIVFILPVRTLDILFGGGGGGVVIGYYVFCVLFIVVLVLVVCSLFSVFRILVVFCF